MFHLRCHRRTRQTRSHSKSQASSLSSVGRVCRALLVGGFWAIAGLTLWTCAPNDVEARPRILRPGTRPAVYMGGIGGDIGIANIGGGRLVIHNTLGYHFSGDSSGPALGGDFDMLIGGSFGLLLGPRFWYDIQIAGMSIYIAPYIRPAIVIDFAYGNVGAYFNLQFGARTKIILNNRAVLFLEFPGIGINIIPVPVGGAIVYAHLRMMFGAGVTF